MSHNEPCERDPMLTNRWLKRLGELHDRARERKRIAVALGRIEAYLSLLSQEETDAIVEVCGELAAFKAEAVLSSASAGGPRETDQ